MRRLGRLLLVSVVLATGTVALGLVVVPTKANAGARLDDRIAPGSDPTALLLIARAERAAYQRGYTGVQYLASWCPSGTTSAIVEVSHVPGMGTTVSVRPTAADAAKTVFAPGSATGARAADQVGAAHGLIARNFRLVVIGADRVAGRPTVVIEARRPVGDTVAARLWLDRETGLPLRQEIFDSTGSAVRATGYLAIRIDGTGTDGTSDPKQAAWPALDTPPVPSEPDLRAVHELVAAGWTVPTELAYGMRLYHVGRLDDGAGMILQLSYSDGLSTVSVFAQRGRLSAAGLAGYRKMRLAGTTVYVYDGMPRRVLWSADGTVYTILADAPDEMIESAVSALPRDTGSRGVLHRVGRGLFRVGSWLNPFN